MNITKAIKSLFIKPLLNLSKIVTFTDNNPHRDEILTTDEVKIFFEDRIETQIKPHPACDHSLFSWITTTATEQGITPEQFNRFRAGMFTRVFTTVPSIFELGRQAALKGDLHTAATAIQNLMEEGGAGKVAKMHPKLMENAFNTLGAEIFGLPPITMKECYENSHLPSSLIYRAIVENFYSTQGTVISYAQEFASGGDNSHENPGMIGNMYNLFYQYRHNLPSGMFEQHILPYFSAHISLDNTTYAQIFKGDAIEFQHGERAKADVLRGIKTADDIERSVHYMLAFLDVQNLFFNTLRYHIEAAQTIGTAIPAITATSTQRENIIPFQAPHEGPHAAAIRKQHNANIAGGYDGR